MKWLLADVQIRYSLLTQDISDGKYVVLPSGELQIRNVSAEDGFKTYKCRTKHRLTGETKLSATAGRLVITGKSDFVFQTKSENVDKFIQRFDFEFSIFAIDMTSPSRQNYQIQGCRNLQHYQYWEEICLSFETTISLLYCYTLRKRNI